MRIVTLIRFKQFRFKQYWLPIVVCFFCLLAIGVDSHERVLAQLPTPDVNTVPRIIITLTPTATMEPIPVVTATPVLLLEATSQVETTVPSSDNQQEANDAVQNPVQNTTDSPASDSPAINPPVTAVKPGATNNPIAEPRTEQAGLVAVDILNMREAPNTSAAIVDQLVRGTQVTLLRQAGDLPGDLPGDLTWWYICCGIVDNRQGWVSAQYLTIMPTGSSDQIAAPEPSPPLQVQLVPLQRFVWQGQRLTLQFKVTNPKTEPVQDVSIRTDLPSAFAFLAATANSVGRQEIEARATAGPIVLFYWPQLAPGAQAIATVDLQITKEVDDGSFLDIIAAVDAEGEETIVTGVTVIMPPSRLPSFR